MNSSVIEADPKRLVAVLKTLSGGSQGAGILAEVAHDARNVVAALSLYCDLVAEPGVLGENYGHYAGELRLLFAASRRLVEKLSWMDSSQRFARRVQCPLPGTQMTDNKPLAGTLSGEPIENLQRELLANRNLLEVIAGPGVRVSVRTEGGARPVRLASEDLTRILVNMVKNASEAMGSTGSIEITLREMPHAYGTEASVMLLVEDTGPGISAEPLDRIFEPGFTTHSEAENASAGEWPAAHRGQGLPITRFILEQAGGRIEAANRPRGGAQFRLELPVCRLREPDEHL